MKRTTALLIALLVSAACERAEPEAEVIRLLDLAPDAASSWPKERPELVPEEIVGVRTFKQLRRRKTGRVGMFSESGGEQRRALVSPAGTRHRFELTLPAGARLEAGLGFLDEPGARGAEIRFVVRLAAGGDGGGETVFEEAATVRSDAGWRDVSIDLGRWSGEDVTLDLLTAGGAAGETVWGAWSAPEVVSATGVEAGVDVLLISLDTLRADRLGCYGYPENTSPNLDAFSANGIRFARAVSQAPWTLPSHKALFSGLYPTSRDIEKAPTLAQMLHRRGYRTEALTGGGQMDFRMGLAEGFDSYRVFDWIRNLDEVESWLRRSSRRNRFLFLHTYEIHDPYTHTEMSEIGTGGRAEGYFDKRTWFRMRDDITPEEKAYVRTLYDGGIAYTDRRLGSLFEMLDETGALDRTIVIITSDHGEQFWEHGSWRHGMNLYDHQVVVPLLVQLPDRLERALAGAGGLTGKVIEQQVRLVDLYPTLLDLLDVPIEHAVNGRSLTPLLRGDPLPQVDAFSEQLNVETRESKALSTERYKFIYSFPKAKGVERGLKENWELYDLARDPGEQENLAERYPERVAQLDARLRTLLELLADPDELDQGDQQLDPDLEQRLRALGYLGD